MASGGGGLGARPARAGAGSSSAAPASSSSSSSSSSGGGSSSASPASSADLDHITVDFLSAFDRQKQDIERTVESVQLGTRQVNSLCEQVKTAFNSDDIDRLSKQLADVVKSAQRDAARGKTLLDALKRDGEALVKTNPKSERVQAYKAQYQRLCKLYVEAVKEHQKSKEVMRKAQTDDLVRRGMIIYGDGKTEGEIREKVERDPANFVREALMEEAADDAQQAYAEAQSRARDVEMLVRSLNEVASMFQDLAVLVQHQSDMLDSIEEHVENAGTFVKKGNEAMRAAIESQKQARKCWCCFIIVLIIVILVTVSGVGAAFGTGAVNH